MRHIALAVLIALIFSSGGASFAWADDEIALLEEPSGEASAQQARDEALLRKFYQDGTITPQERVVLQRSIGDARVFATRVLNSPDLGFSLAQTQQQLEKIYGLSPSDARTIASKAFEDVIKIEVDRTLRLAAQKNTKLSSSEFKKEASRITDTAIKKLSDRVGDPGLSSTRFKNLKLQIEQIATNVYHEVISPKIPQGPFELDVVAQETRALRLKEIRGILKEISSSSYRGTPEHFQARLDELAVKLEQFKNLGGTPTDVDLLTRQINNAANTYTDAQKHTGVNAKDPTRPQRVRNVLSLDPMKVDALLEEGTSLMDRLKTAPSHSTEQFKLYRQAQAFLAKLAATEGTTAFSHYFPQEGEVSSQFDRAQKLRSAFHNVHNLYGEGFGHFEQLIKKGYEPSFVEAVMQRAIAEGSSAESSVRQLTQELQNLREKFQRRKVGRTTFGRQAQSLTERLNAAKASVALSLEERVNTVLRTMGAKPQNASPSGFAKFFDWLNPRVWMKNVGNILKKFSGLFAPKPVPVAAPITAPAMVCVAPGAVPWYKMQLVKPSPTFSSALFVGVPLVIGVVKGIERNVIVGDQGLLESMYHGAQEEAVNNFANPVGLGFLGGSLAITSVFPPAGLPLLAAMLAYSAYGEVVATTQAKEQQQRGRDVQTLVAQNPAILEKAFQRFFNTAADQEQQALFDPLHVVLGNNQWTRWAISNELYSGAEVTKFHVQLYAAGNVLPGRTTLLPNAALSRVHDEALLFKQGFMASARQQYTELQLRAAQLLATHKDPNVRQQAQDVAAGIEYSLDSLRGAYLAGGSDPTKLYDAIWRYLQEPENQQFRDIFLTAPYDAPGYNGVALLVRVLYQKLAILRQGKSVRDILDAAEAASSCKTIREGFDALQTLEQKDATAAVCDPDMRITLLNQDEKKLIAYAQQLTPEQLPSFQQCVKEYYPELEKALQAPV